MSIRRMEASLLRSVNLLAVVEWTAFFSAYIVMGVYLVEVAGFDDVGAGWVAGAFGLGLCILPSLGGAVADRIGFRRMLVGSYLLQTLGFTLLAFARSPAPAVAGLALVAVGGAATRAVLLGAVGRTEPTRRARAYSVMMQAINVGCFLGKLAARPLRLEWGLASVDAFSAVAFVVAGIVAFVAFRVPQDDVHGQPRSLRATFAGMTRVLRDARFVGMIAMVGLFWAVQGQMYATMPRFALRLAGPASSPEWYAMVNSVVCVAFMVPVTHWTRDWSMGRTLPIAYGLLAAATALMGLGPWLVGLSGGAWHFGGIDVSPFAVTFMVGAGLSGLAECFLLPRYLDRIAAMAPPGQAALYQGYGYLSGLVSNVVGWGLSGYLLERWCPAPEGVPGAVEALALAAAGDGAWPAPWSGAPWIFLAWAALAVGALALLPAWSPPRYPRGSSIAAQ